MEQAPLEGVAEAAASGWEEEGIKGIVREPDLWGTVFVLPVGKK